MSLIASIVDKFVGTNGPSHHSERAKLLKDCTVLVNSPAIDWKHEFVNKEWDFIYSLKASNNSHTFTLSEVRSPRYENVYALTISENAGGKIIVNDRPSRIAKKLFNIADNSLSPEQAEAVKQAQNLVSLESQSWKATLPERPHPFASTSYVTESAGKEFNIHSYSTPKGMEYALCVSSANGFISVGVTSKCNKSNPATSKSIVKPMFDALGLRLEGNSMPTDYR